MKKPIICVCQLNGIVGIVLWEDYEYSDSYRRRRLLLGIQDYDSEKNVEQGGVLLKIPDDQIFVFLARSPEYKAIASHCFIERKVFHLPIAGHWEYDEELSKQNLQSAKKHIFKERLLPLANVYVIHNGRITTPNFPLQITDHNFPCPVCRQDYAVLNYTTEAFEPCRNCQNQNWKLQKVSSLQKVASLEKVSSGIAGLISRLFAKS